MKVNKKGNLIMAVFCLLVGLALVGTGIYYLASGKSLMTGGIILALGVVICGMFAVTCVTMKKFEKMKAEADARYTLEQERQYRAVKEMIERIRAAEGNITQDEIAAIVADAKRKALSENPVFDEETSSEEGAEKSGGQSEEEGDVVAPRRGDGEECAPEKELAEEFSERTQTGGGLPEGASPYRVEDGESGETSDADGRRDDDAEK